MSPRRPMSTAPAWNDLAAAIDAFEYIGPPMSPDVLKRGIR